MRSSARRCGLSAALFVTAMLLVLGVGIFVPKVAFAEIAHGQSGDIVWTIGDDHVLTFSPQNGREGTFGKDFIENVDDPDPDDNYGYRERQRFAWLDHANQIYSVRFTGTCHGNGSAGESHDSEYSYSYRSDQGMFSGCTRLKSIDFSHFDTSAITDMSNLFYDCQSMTNYNFSHFDTSNVTDMSSMFYNNRSLTTNLNLSKIDTSNVANMSGMFQYCNYISTLDLSHFHTSNVTDMSSMFFDCERLKTINLSSFDTIKVTNMQYMFGICSQLESLDLSTFRTPSLVNTRDMFSSCFKLKQLDISSMDTSGCTSMSDMFGYGYFDNVSLGKNFTFKGVGSTVRCALNYEGDKSHVWQLNGRGKEYTADELAQAYDGRTMAGTWVRKDVSNRSNGGGSSTSAKSMYRLYNPNSGEHFYTANTNERNDVIAAGWNYEGIGWTAPASGNPVYRLYNRNGGEHHYTLSASERNTLIAAGWSYEGVGWYSSTKREVPIYRQYNPNQFSCNHNYTASKAENDRLVRAGWRAEGIGWYGVRQ